MIGLALISAIALVILAKAADQFVLGAARLAIAFEVSTVVIGAVVVGFGTSAPEMVVSGLAAANGRADLAVGNVIGSNVANLTLVLGAAALLHPLRVSSRVLRREAPLATGAVVVLALVVQDGISTLEGVALAVAMAGALALMMSGGRSETVGAEGLSVDEPRADLEADPPRIRTEIIRLALGLVGTVGGAQLLIHGATGIADELDLAEGFVGLTLVAVGTSLPELVTAVAAARQGEDGLIIGNLLGSNIFNSLAVGSLIGLVGSGSLDDAALTGAPAVLMVGVSVAAWIFMRTGRGVIRVEGVALLIAYLVTVPLLAG